MTKYEIPAWNESGLDNSIEGVAQTVNAFTPMLLLFVFVFVFFTGYQAQKKSDGRANPAAWGLIAGVSTTMIALALTVMDQVINLPTLITTVAITILMALWFFNSREI